LLYKDYKAKNRIRSGICSSTTGWESLVSLMWLIS